jgi:hypothetical protein
MKSLFLLLITIGLLAACTSTEEEAKIGKYVYVDDNYGTVHVDRHCEILCGIGTTRKERLIQRYGIDYVDTCYFHDSYAKVCPNCVSDEAYQHLQSIIRRNMSK